MLDPAKLKSKPELCIDLRCGEGTLNRILKKHGIGPAAVIGNRNLYHTDTIMAALASAVTSRAGAYR